MSSCTATATLYTKPAPANVSTDSWLSSWIVPSKVVILAAKAVSTPSKEATSALVAEISAAKAVSKPSNLVSTDTKSALVAEISAAKASSAPINLVSNEPSTTPNERTSALVAEISAAKATSNESTDASKLPEVPANNNSIESTEALIAVTSALVADPRLGCAKNAVEDHGPLSRKA